MRFLNGTRRKCIELDAPLCDVCHSHQTGDFLDRKWRNEDLIDELKNSVKRQKMYDAQVRMKEQAVAFCIDTWNQIESVKEEISVGCLVCWFLNECDFQLPCVGRMSDVEGLFRHTHNGGNTNEVCEL
jgi:hypothetical protein